jgi:type II secretion system protein C
VLTERAKDKSDHEERQSLLAKAKGRLNQFVASKLPAGDVSVPKLEPLLPWIAAATLGFMVAVAVGWGVAYSLMPPARKVGAAQENAVGAGPKVRLPTQPLLTEFDRISQRNLFDSSGVGAASTNASSSECVPQKSSLPLRVKGIIFGGTSDTSLALLESSATQQVDSFVQGEQVPGNARISEISRDRVYFLQGSCPEYLEIDQPEQFKRRTADPSKRTKAEPTGDGADSDYAEEGFERRGERVSVDKQWIEKAIGVDFAKTLQDAKATPNVVAGGQVKGFVMTQIRPDSVYEKMGMVNGDIVRSINGIELNDAARAIQTLQSMKTETQLEVLIEREGKVITTKIQVK